MATPQPVQHNWYGAGSAQQAAQPQPVQHNWYGAGSAQQAAQPQPVQHNRYDAVVPQQQPQHAGLQHQQSGGAVYQQPRPAQPVLQSQYPAPVAAATLAPMARESFDSSVFSKNTGTFRGRIQSLLLWGCLLTGAAITLYRNDVLLKGAQQLNQEAAFLKLEKQWLGGAPAGTPRQVKALTSQATVTATSGVRATAGDAPLSAGSRENRETTRGAGDSSAAGVSDAASRAAETGASAQQSPAKPSTDGEGAGSKSASSNPAALSPSQREPGRTRGESAKAERAQQSPTPAAKRVSTTRSKPARSTPRVRSAKAAAEKPPKVEQKPASATPMPAAGSDDFLRMSMRNAVKDAKVKKKAAKSAKQKKKREGASSYDPLNGEI